MTTNYLPRVGWVGLGKLGLPCALVLADAGLEVYGYDPAPARKEGLAYEEGIEDLTAPVVHCKTMAELARAEPDVVFVAVQTPHAPAYDGTRDAPAQTRDFDYTFLAQAVRDVEGALADHLHTLVIVSTVLPGTIDRVVRPLLGRNTALVYSPALIAMGTTITDFRLPEMVIVGMDPNEDADDFFAVHEALGHRAPIARMSIRSAEATKVLYNTFVSLKVVFGNAVLEIADAVGADCDSVVDALALGTQRITSAAYLRGGMGDGGSCHPRDNIALAHLAASANLSVDPFTFVTRSREDYSRWLARRITQVAESVPGMPLAMLGRAYKPGVPLDAGSPALLLASHLTSLGITTTYFGDEVPGVLQRTPHLIVLATAHEEYRELAPRSGSVVFDPFGIVPDRTGVRIVRPGRHGRH